MSEIEKMYENAEIKKQIPKICSSNELYCKECEAHIEDAMPYCQNAEYPPFTAEKQLELIKWIMCKKQTIQVELRLYENDYCISHITECEDNDAVEYVETGRKNTFDEALADLVNELWNDLTEEEQEQIRSILNG